MSTRTIACLFSITSHYTLCIIEGVAAYIARNPHLRLEIPGQIPFKPLVSIHDFDGAGIIGFFSSPEEAAPFQKRGIVVVNVSSVTDQIRPWVHVNNRRVGALAADGLCAQGFQHFLYVDFLAMIEEHNEKKEVLFSSDLLAGFQGRLRERNLDCERLRLRMSSFRQPATWNLSLQRLARQLQRLPRPLGIYCVNDNAAGLVLMACQEAGLRVPDEIAVIGTDNDSLICNGLEPRLSSIEHGPERLGWTAVRLLDGILAGREPADAEICLDPVELVERDSSSSRHVDDPLIAEALRQMRQSLDDHSLVAALPERLGMSRRSFERRFKAAVALSPAQELIRLRLQKIQRELLRSQRSIKEIALNGGFCSAEHLQKTFRQHFQMSPDVWRKLNRQPAASRHHSSDMLGVSEPKPESSL
jgi:LacI family transcriptional regulator